MTDFVTALLTTINIDAFWDSLAPAAPLITIGVLFGFGYMVIKRVVRGLGRGKAKV